MSKLLIRNARLVNEGRTVETDVLIENGFIAQIKSGIPDSTASQIIEANGQFLLPGVIDDQVHFREPGLTHKATIHSESRAAVAGGVTSFMEMPNTVPNALTQELLAQKYAIGAKTSLANYSFLWVRRTTTSTKYFEPTRRRFAELRCSWARQQAICWWIMSGFWTHCSGKALC